MQEFIRDQIAGDERWITACAPTPLPPPFIPTGDGDEGSKGGGSGGGLVEEGVGIGIR